MKRSLHLLVLVFITFQVLKAGGNNPPVYYYPGTSTDSTDILSSYSVKIKDGTVYLNWRLTSPRDIYYFDIQRLDPRSREYKTITDKRIKKDDYFEKSANNEGQKIYMYD